ncbi:hypothetical protein [Spiroplasma endosymbiont of Amphibalanus improvisus]|uniref:hypothetical protein n=1 Tax=Spiroplasma endosymbiont of Amphibalanus improvisus TaxID=3066327 RepID=UPI00313E8396
MKEISSKPKFFNLPSTSDGTYASLLKFDHFPYAGSTDSDAHSKDSDETKWAKEGNNRIF